MTLLEAYEYQKARADLLQKDLDEVDLLHYDEVSKLKTEITMLKQKVKLKELN